VVFRLETLAQCVKRARPDVAVDDAERNEGQLSEPLSCGMRLRMVENWEVLL
jgi:hypothetical protein